ncbi:hypothetical protein Ancab_005145 [Ancistrocladus abbreviatus]
MCVEFAFILDYVLVSDGDSDSIQITETSAQSCLPGGVEESYVFKKLVEGKILAMVDPRKEDKQPELQTKMTGLVAGKEAGNQTHDEELKSAGEKVLLQVPRCTGHCGFSTDLDVVQCRINGGVPRFVNAQPEMGLIAYLEKEMMGSQYKAHRNKEVATQSPTTCPFGGNEIPLHPHMDLGSEPLAQDLSITERRGGLGSQSISLGGDLGHKTKKKNLNDILNLSPH